MLRQPQDYINQAVFYDIKVPYVSITDISILSFNPVNILNHIDSSREFPDFHFTVKLHMIKGLSGAISILLSCVKD